ncbi:hypothetical protein PWT90_01149 [Aphanocladium album]|nr:hypothetical protein PWT90_01149 [Aphanocladium album]
MSAPVQNVTLIGATGNVGTVALERLSESRHNLQVLRRQGSKSTYPSSIKVVDVDFTSLAALTAALQGQDAVIVTLPAEVAALQRTIVDAAIAAGVRRFVPTEFGSNSDNALARQIPVFGEKVKIQEYLKEKAGAGAGAGPLSYTFVYTGPFLDWGIQHNFVLDVTDYKPRLINDGKTVFSTTNVGTIGRALVAILDHLDETENRSVFLEDLKISQQRLLELAKQAAPEKPWEVNHVKLDDLVQVAGEQLAKGVVNLDSVTPFLYKSFLSEGYGGNFEKTDNELLGLDKSSEEFVLELYKKILQVGNNGDLPTSFAAYSCGCVKDSKFLQCEKRKDTPIKCDKIRREITEELDTYCLSHCMADRGRGLTNGDFKVTRNGDSGPVGFELLTDVSVNTE